MKINNGINKHVYHFRKSQVSYVKETEECYHIYMNGICDSDSQRISIYKNHISEEDIKTINDLLSYIDYQD